MDRKFRLEKRFRKRLISGETPNDDGFFLPTIFRMDQARRPRTDGQNLNELRSKIFILKVRMNRGVKRAIPFRRNKNPRGENNGFNGSDWVVSTAS